MVENCWNNDEYEHNDADVQYEVAGGIFALVCYEEYQTERKKKNVMRCLQVYSRKHTTLITFQNRNKK